VVAEPTQPSGGDPTLDRLGVGLSLACMVHCLAVPLLALLPALTGRVARVAAPIEWALLAGAVIVGLRSLVPSFRAHGRATPLALLLAGFAVLALGRLAAGEGTAAELAASLLGLACIASAHVLNLRIRPRC
jgi:hypothetical protein